MAIGELRAQQGNVNIVITISDKGQIREFEKFGKKGRVCNVIGEDDTGKISLTLWNDDVDKVNPGDKVEIKNGYVGEYRGELQLGTGKFGTMAVIGKSEIPKPEKDIPGDKTVPKEESDDFVHDAESVQDDDES